MYNVVNDAGNIYMYDTDENLVNYKDIDILNSIAEDNSIISGVDIDLVNEIIDYCNNYTNEKTIDLPWYLTQSEIDKTKIVDES